MFATPAIAGSFSEARVSDRVENSDIIVPDLGSPVSTESESLTFYLLDWRTPSELDQ